jgi:hypothetical protein
VPHFQKLLRNRTNTTSLIEIVCNSVANEDGVEVTFLDIYSEGSRFESRPRYWLRFIVVFLAVSRKISGEYSTHRPTVRQRLGKNTFPRGPTRATIGRILRRNGSVNTLKTIRDNRRRCFLWRPPQGHITGSSKGAVRCHKLRDFICVSCCRELGRVLEMAVGGNWE